MRNHMKRLVINGHPFTGGHHPEIPDYVLHSYPVEIICLTPRKNRRKNLVLLCRGKNEDGMGRRLLKCFQKGVESRLREHVDLINDINAVSSHLRRYAYLVHKGLDVIHAIVRGRVQLMYAI